jgi:hypothetical protein
MTCHNHIARLEGLRVSENCPGGRYLCLNFGLAATNSVIITKLYIIYIKYRFTFCPIVSSFPRAFPDRTGSVKAVRRQRALSIPFEDHRARERSLSEYRSISRRLFPAMGWRGLLRIHGTPPTTPCEQSAIYSWFGGPGTFLSEYCNERVRFNFVTRQERRLKPCTTRMNFVKG